MNRMVFCATWRNYPFSTVLRSLPPVRVLASFADVNTDGPMDVYRKTGTFTNAGVRRLDTVTITNRLRAHPDKVAGKRDWLILDSGAFTAWKQGKPISLHEYIGFLGRNKDVLDEYIALDSIPDAQTADEVRKAGIVSFDNYQKMLDCDLRPVPVFHRGEDEKWLGKYLETKPSILALSPLVGTEVSQQREWLNRMYRIIPRTQKTHVLGYSSVDAYSTYPAETMDSTSWYRLAAYGRIPYIPDSDNSFSIRSLSVTEDGQDSVHRLSTPERAELDRFLARCGTTIQRCQIDYVQRAMVCAHVYLRVGDIPMPTQLPGVQALI